MELSFTVVSAALRAVVLAIFSRYLSIKGGRRNASRFQLRSLKAMTTFDKREEAFEKKFAIDEEQKFKAGARRNKLLGLWVADRLGITGDAAAAYAKEVIAAEFDGTGDNGVIRKVMGDFGSKGVTLDEVELRAKMTELMVEAIAQVKAGV